MFLRVFQTDKTLIRISPLSAYLTPAGQKRKREKEREVWLHWEQVDEEEEENEEREREPSGSSMCSQSSGRASLTKTESMHAN